MDFLAFGCGDAECKNECGHGQLYCPELQTEGLVIPPLALLETLWLVQITVIFRLERNLQTRTVLVTFVTKK